ncbi:hypothetical protein SAMN05192529_11768 [Arachidicoccus rhizosphaerae]|uniref:Uncharacterized protein n=1 Tax=Arachidicoccus rhizosphaerae TaxID=551991 RepID=A0A1H4B027_9BACT|nr:hypothetical protein [Arachidicoccus rhizosphaerae]SEA41480.1 hypothetical protein SAMN05192529_11768 [Arachidicoccus rhizosphaerae]
MNQQELEVIVNHIVVKQDEMLLAVKAARVEPDFSAVLSEIGSNRQLLEEIIQLTISKNEEALKRYGEKLQTQLDNQKALNLVFAQNCHLLEHFKQLHMQKKGLKINQLSAWIKKNVAWIAFFCICVTFCFAIYFIEFRKTETPTYRNLTGQQLSILDLYLDEHPKAVDSLLESINVKLKGAGINK